MGYRNLTVPSLSYGNANVRRLQRQRLRRTGQNDRSAKKLRRRPKGGQNPGSTTRKDMHKRKRRGANRARTRNPRPSDRSRSDDYSETLLRALRRRSKLNSPPLQLNPT